MSVMDVHGAEGYTVAVMRDASLHAPRDSRIHA